MSFFQWVLLIIIGLFTLTFCIFTIVDRVLKYKENKNDEELYKSIKEYTERFNYMNEENIKLRGDMRAIVNEINDKVENLESQLISRFDNYKTVIDMEMVDISKRLSKVEVV